MRAVPEKQQLDKYCAHDNAMNALRFRSFCNNDSRNGNALLTIFKSRGSLTCR